MREPGRWRTLLLSLAILFPLIAGGAAVRIATALGDPLFDTQDSRGLLRADPGLIFYLTERLIEDNGVPPADWRADPRIEHPEVSDIPAMFTVGQEYAVAWLWLALGGGVPLHVFCVWVLGILAALSVVGVYGAAHEVTRSVGWAGMAAALFCVLPANYRTIGFVLVREDLSLPLYALHLWFLARTVRTRGMVAAVFAALTLVAALATWHALGFVVAIELAVLYAYYLWSGRNVLESRAALVALAVVAAGCLAVPVLRSKLVLLGPAGWLAIALGACALLGSRIGARPSRRVLFGASALAGAAVLATVLRAVLPGGGDYGHVLPFMLAKLTHLGQLPEDPATIDFDTRLLWQGPFATMPLGEAVTRLGLGLGLLVLSVVAAARLLRQPSNEDSLILTAGFALASLGAAWLVVRLAALTGLLVPVASVVFLARFADRRKASWAMATVVTAQLVWFATWIGGYEGHWYQPKQRQIELRAALSAIERIVPEGEAVATDFTTATAVLAQTRRPAVLQPKYETARSRRRIEEFLHTFFHCSPEELRRLLRDRFQCRWLLLDRAEIWTNDRYFAGLPRSPGVQPRPGTAAYALLQADPRSLARVPGFELRYVSPPDLLPPGQRQPPQWLPGWYVLLRVRE